MNRYLVRNLFWLSLTGLSSSLFGQAYDFRHYGVADGLAQSQVFTLLEDTRGYIWMGTRGGGLSRFDGRNFTQYTTRDSLVFNYILCLYEAKDGRIWVGTDQGISHYDGRRFRTEQPDSNQVLAVNAMAEGPDGHLWAATSQGVYVRNDSQWTHLSVDWPQGRSPASCLYPDGDTIWIGRRRGLIAWTADTLLNFGLRQGLSRTDVRAVEKDSLGQLWVAVYAGGLYSRKGRRLRPFLKDQLPTELIFDLHWDQQGKLWMATQNEGAVVWNSVDSSLLVLNTESGLPNSHVHALLEDSWGNMWLGTSGGGVSKYFGQSFVHFSDQPGLRGNYIYSLAEDLDCRIWMGSSAEGVSIWEGGTFTPLGEPEGFKNIKVKSLLSDRRGRMWLGTEGQGITIWRDTVLLELKANNGLGGNWIRKMVQDSSGAVWVATAGGGISRVRLYEDSTGIRSQTRTWRVRHGLPSNRINDLYLDMYHRLWFATARDGIGFIKADSTVFRLPRLSAPTRNHVRSLTGDRAGQLWVGTAGGGVSRLDLGLPPDSMQMLDQSTRLSSDNIYLLAFDELDQLWIGSEQGLDRAALDLDRNIIDIKHFGAAEGFIGIETCQNAVMQDREGYLWFGTIDGLTQYTPNVGLRNPYPPKVSLTDISLFYTPLKRSPDYRDELGPWQIPDSVLAFSFRQNHLSFDFTGINHRNPEQVRYQWQLVGLEDAWSPVSERTSATYANLNPGDYTFRVRAVNEDGVWSKELEVELAISPPLWQLWQVQAGAAAFIAILLLVLFRLRLNQVRRKARQDRERLEMERNLVDLEQKALRLQMNPHFIFNALASIQHLISQQDSKAARYFLAKFSKLMRLVLENSREAWIDFDHEIETLEGYMALERFTRNEQFSYTINIDPELEKGEWEIPPMLIQPFIENAIIHGIAPLATKGHISLEFSLDGQVIRCQVQDNGVGRQAAKRNSPEGHRSTGLAVTQERLEILHEEIDTPVQLEIRDLVDPAGKPAGTLVLLSVPVRDGA